MTTRSKLMLMAAALAPLPLYAQQPETVPAPVPAVVATADQAPTAAATRAGVLTPLACVAQDADFALVITNPLKRFGLQEMAENDPITAAIKNVAMAGGKGVSLELANAYTMFVLAAYQDGKAELVKNWAQVVKAELKGVLENAAKDIPTADQAKFVGTLAQFKVHPHYGIVEFSSEEMARQAYDGVIKGMKSEAEYDDQTDFVTIGNFSGIKHTGKATEADPDEEFSFMGAVEAELDKRTFHALFAVNGKNLVSIFCEDPAEISVPTAPEASILNTPAFDAVDANLADDLIAVSYVSPALCQAGYAGASALVDAAGPFAAIFEKMADNDAASADALKAAAAGVRAIAAQVSDTLVPIEKPMMLQIWGTEGAYHAEMTTDACGYEFVPAKLALTEKAGNAETILCFEMTPAKCNNTMDLNTVASACTAVYNGILASLAPELQQLISGQLEQAVEFLPEASSACSAVCSILGGMGGTAGIVIDGKGEAPAFLTGGEEAALPRVAFYSGVTDRAMLSKGWDGLMQVAGDILEKAGQSRAMLAMIPIVPAQVGEAAMSYSVVVPGILTPDMGLNVTVSDTAFAAGSSSALNSEIVTTASATQEFAGATMVINAQPLAVTARSLADAMLKAAGPIEVKRHYFDEDEVKPEPVVVKDGESEEEEPAPAEEAKAEAQVGCGCGSCKLDEQGECICSEEEDGCDDEDADDDDYLCVEADDISYRFSTGTDENGRHYYEEAKLKPGQEQAYDMADYAKSLENFAKAVKDIKTDVTIKDGVQTIHVDVNLNVK